ncbi:MAG: aldehyde dehydrogenase family protein, partial [Clostridiaceae bacterium]
MSEPIILKPFINGEYVESVTEKYADVYNPSTGKVIAKAPQCTKEEVEKAVEAAKNAYPSWSNVPAHKRAQYFFRLRELLREHLTELTELVARENGKVWSEAEGDVLKAIEMTEIATSIPNLIMGEALMDTSLG